MANLEDFEKLAGYKFKNIGLLRHALSHSSYANEHRREGVKDNERLEFLGDAVLELASSEFLFKHNPDMPEGDMTKLRASLVCEPTLAMCARELGLPQFILLGKGEERTGGRQRDSIVSDAMEAVIGAIFLDGGFANAKEYILKFILNDYEHKKLFFDSKTILQEIVQRDFKNDEIVYEIDNEEGPEHAKHFAAEVKLGGRMLGRGIGSTKKAAEQDAAYRAILTLKGTNNVSEVN